ncbi:MAG: flavin reductase family protein [Actinobacteria bacterium]|nr:flavin reductase family protein [Actinomycetota bacterium]
MTIVTSAAEPSLFRQVLGCYATGVVVVAALVDGVPQGLAVNSFTSVSMDPPLVAFCAARTSSTWPALRRSGAFAVSVLSREQEHACRVFARKGADRFAEVRWTVSPGGHPVLDGALAWLDLRAGDIHQAGDHELVIGEVTGLGAAGGGQPLVFFRSAFADVAEAAAAAGTGGGADAGPEALGELRGLDVESPFFAVLAARLGADESQ